MYTKFDYGFQHNYKGSLIAYVRYHYYVILNTNSSGVFDTFIITTSSTSQHLNMYTFQNISYQNDVLVLGVDA